MTQMLFFKGHGGSALGAIESALANCAPILVNNPSLLIELEDISPMGKNWDAHIRVMSLDVEAQSGDATAHHHKSDPSIKYNVKNADVAKRVNMDDWKILRHDHPEAAFRFGNSAMGGEVPDVPIQDFQVSDYEMARASEPELKRILQEINEKHLKVIEQAKLELE